MPLPSYSDYSLGHPLLSKLNLETHFYRHPHRNFVYSRAFQHANCTTATRGPTNITNHYVQNGVYINVSIYQ